MVSRPQTPEMCALHTVGDSDGVPQFFGFSVQLGLLPGGQIRQMYPLDYGHRGICSEYKHFHLLTP